MNQPMRQPEIFEKLLETFIVFTKEITRIRELLEKTANQQSVQIVRNEHTDIDVQRIVDAVAQGMRGISHIHISDANTDIDSAGKPEIKKTVKK